MSILPPSPDPNIIRLPRYLHQHVVVVMAEGTEISKVNVIDCLQMASASTCLVVASFNDAAKAKDYAEVLNGAFWKLEDERLKGNIMLKTDAAKISQD